MKTMKCLKLTVAVCVLSLTAFADRREIKVLEQSGPKCAAYCVRYADDKHRPDEVRNRDEIEEIFVSYLVREIPDGMFANMPNLRSVTLDGSLKIGSRAFANCPRLEYVIAEKLDLEELPADAFEGCSPACVRIRGGWRPVVEEVRPLYGWSREYWMPMGGDVQGMRRTSDGFYAHDRDGLRLVYYTGTNEVLRLPSSIDGIAVKGIADSAISFGSSVRSLILPPTVEERFDRWPGSNEAGESMVTTVFCEGAVPRGLSGGDAKTQPRRLYARERTGRSEVIHVPPAVPMEYVLTYPEAYRENEEATALVIGDRAWLQSVKTQQKDLVVPATFEGATVMGLSDEVMRNRTARNIRVPAALRWGWLLDTYTFGEAVREFHDRYAHEPNGVDLSALPEDNTKESVDLHVETNRFKNWKLLDARGDYLQALKAIDAAAAAGASDAKLGLINYLRYGRPGLYCIVDENKALELEGGLSPELAANVFMIDSDGRALPDWRQTMKDDDRSFWIRYRALRGDVDARRLLGKNLVYRTLPTLGVFAKDAPATAVKEGEFVGFDLEAQDYCAPQGKGRVAHLMVKAMRNGRTRSVIYQAGASVTGLPAELTFDGRWFLEPDGRKGLSPMHATVLATEVDGKPMLLRRPTRVIDGSEMTLVPVLVKTASDEAVYCGTEEEVTVETVLPEGERICDLEGIACLRINMGVSEIPERLFENSPDLRTVVLGRQVTSIGTRAFANSRNLSLIYLEDGCRAPQVADDAFAELEALKWRRKK